MSMENQTSFLDELQRKETGLRTIREHTMEFQERMRIVAENICRNKGTVTSDDLRFFADQARIKPIHKNAWGGIFHGNGWTCVGRKKSEYPGNHAREIKIWAMV